MARGAQSCSSRMCPFAAVSASRNSVEENCAWESQITYLPKSEDFARSVNADFADRWQGVHIPRIGLRREPTVTADWAGPVVEGKLESWRAPSSRSFNEANAALQRALGSMSKISGEPETVRTQRKLTQAALVGDRTITNSEARTMSMRERGRWGSKTGGSCNLPMPVHEINQMHRIQCQHCGNFSTTPACGSVRAVKSRSQSFRRVRDYSWQQELRDQLVGHKKMDGVAKESTNDGKLQACMEGCRGQVFDYETDGQNFHSAEFRPRGAAHLGSAMPWHEHMCLSQAVAALDCGKETGGAESSRWGCSCDCASCQGCESWRETHANGRAGILETFSGPLGYTTTESTTGWAATVAEEGSRRRRRWWQGGLGMRSRSRDVGKEQRATARVWRGEAEEERQRQGQATVQCVACGQRLWVQNGWREGAAWARLCNDCHDRAGGSGGARPRRPFPAPPPLQGFTCMGGSAGGKASTSRKLRLIKMCRYLLGFPMKTG